MYDPTTRLAPHASRGGRCTKRALLLATLGFGLASISNVHAIGLDEIAQQSPLGEPLRLVIPVLSNAGDQLSGDEFAGECFKLVPAVANDLPQLNSARLTLERRGGQAFVVLTTAYPIDEPVIRVAVQAGCRVSISREYTVLFDPVSISPPVVEKGTEAPAAAAVAERAESSAPALATTTPESGPVQSSVPPPKHAATVARRKPDNAPKRASQAVAAMPRVASPAAKASDQPRLQVSRTVNDASTAPVAGVAPTPAAQREAMRTIEEQTVVLQRQIAELSLQMERMQQDLIAARVARDEAERAARAAEGRAKAAASTWATLRAWAGVNWPLLVLLPTLAILVAALLVHIRRERPTIPAPFTAAQAEAFNPADLGEPSVPVPDAVRDEEVVVASIKDAYRQHMSRPVFADPVDPGGPKTTEYVHDPGITFDDEVQKTAEESSVYSVLEREQPGIVARLMTSWGTPRAAKQVETYLLTPRPSGRALSRGAMEELKLLRSIAME